MATTAMQIFNTAMGFMDEVSTDGKTDTTDTAEYKNRTQRSRSCKLCVY